MKHDDYKIAPIPERLMNKKRIAILTGDDAEDLEFFYPYYRFSEAGYDVDVITPEGGEFECKKGTKLGESRAVTEVNPNNYELLYLPGGKAPEKLCKEEKVVKFVRDFAVTGKPIASICHGALILIAADIIRGKKIAAWPEIKDEVEEAGATFADEALKEDGQFITARKPGDLHRHLYGVFQYLNSN